MSVDRILCAAIPRSLAVSALAALAGCSSLVGFDQPAERGPQCEDGVDNDGNGRMDCDEPVCAVEAPSCQGACGNGIPEDGEQCDDGNRVPGDGCEADCTVPCRAEIAADLRRYDPATGTCYLGFLAPTVPPNANAACVALGGHLAVPDSEAENSLLRGAAPPNAWLGLSDTVPDDLRLFRSVTGDLPASFEAWSLGEPNQALGSPACVVFDGDLPTWRDEPCEDQRPYVCELAADPCGDFVVQAEEVCDDGNPVNGDGCSACADDDECTFVPSLCAPDATCMNLVQSPVAPGFLCTCDPGFVGDGFTCTPDLATFAVRGPEVISGGLVGCTTASSTTGRKLAIDDRGTLYAALRCSGDVFVTASRDGGVSWLPPTLVGAAVSAVEVLGMTVDRVVVAMLGEGGTVVVRVSANGGASWGDPVVAASGVRPDASVSLARQGDQLVLGALTDGGQLRVVRALDATLTSFAATDALPANVGDVLVDPVVPSMVWAIGEATSLALAPSADGGATFGEAIPLAANLGDLDAALGGGQVVVVGQPDEVGRFSLGGPGTLESVRSLPLSVPRERAIAADAVGDAVVAQANQLGGVSVIRLPHDAPRFDAPVVVDSDATASSPSVLMLPGGLAAVVYGANEQVRFAIVNPASPPMPVADLVHRWSFEGGSLVDPVGGASLEVFGGASVVGGALVLDGIDDYARSAPLSSAFVERTLLAWVSLANLEQQGGSALTLEDPAGADVFDAIVFGEVAAGKWAAGSENGNRSSAPDGDPEMVAAPGIVMLAITYATDGSIQLYRDGAPYGTGYTPPSAVTYPTLTTDVLLGARHEDVLMELGTETGIDPFLAGALLDVQIYARALTAAEVGSLYLSGPDGP